MQKQAKQMDMVHGPLLQKLILFSIPIIASGMLQLLFNAADVIVVGRFAGENSLAAVGSTGSLVNLLTNLFIGMSVGANVCAAQSYGAGHEEDVSKTLHTSVAFSLVCGLALSVFCIIASPKLLLLMGSPENVINLASLYLRIYFIGLPAVMVFNYASGVLRAAGDTRHPLYYLTAAGVINVLLNLLLVVRFNMDVAGVAIATITAQYISAVLVLIFLAKSNGPLHFSIWEVRIERKILKKIIRIGLPAGIQGTVFSLSNVVIQSSINSFGSIVIAGNSAAQSIEGFVYMAMNAMQQTAITFTGQNFGAGDEKRVKRVLYECLIIVTIIGLVLGNLAYNFGNQLLGIYSSNPEVVAAGLVRMRWICTIYFLCGVMDVLTGMMRGMGKSTVPMIVSIIGACGLRLVWIFTYFRFHHTEPVLYFSYAGSWLVTIIAHSICFTIIYRKWIERKNSQIRI